MLTFTFEELQSYTFEDGFDDEICIILDEMKYFFYLKYHSKFDDLICFSNGAINPAKMKPPVYQRFTWRNEFSASCLFIDDPTLHGNGLKLGWGQGTKEVFGLEAVAKIVRVFMDVLSYAEEKTVFYGSSAGGYMSIYLGTLVQRTRVIVNNPQTYVLNYHERNVNEMLEKIYPGMSREEIIEAYSHRLSLTQAFSKNKYTPQILYMQNRACVSDMKRHLDPFMKNIQKYKGIMDTHIEFYLYKHPKEGHNPLPKDETIRMIRNFLD